jgi:hypothetical protein
VYCAALLFQPEQINYEDLRLIMPPIGKGGFAVVNKAKYKGTTVAVKTYFAPCCVLPCCCDCC